MSLRLKKLLGTFIIVIWLIVYIVLASGFARLILPHATWYSAFGFYAVAGTLWIVPIGLMLPWMSRERK